MTSAWIHSEQYSSCSVPNDASYSFWMQASTTVYESMVLAKKEMYHSTNGFRGYVHYCCTIFRTCISISKKRQVAALLLLRPWRRARFLSWKYFHSTQQSVPHQSESRIRQMQIRRVIRRNWHSSAFWWLWITTVLWVPLTAQCFKQIVTVWTSSIYLYCWSEVRGWQIIWLHGMYITIALETVIKPWAWQRKDCNDSFL